MKKTFLLAAILLVSFTTAHSISPATVEGGSQPQLIEVYVQYLTEDEHNAVLEITGAEGTVSFRPVGQFFTIYVEAGSSIYYRYTGGDTMESCAYTATLIQNGTVVSSQKQTNPPVTIALYTPPFEPEAGIRQELSIFVDRDKCGQ